ncbi:hypothetical protein TcWFU_000868 [Taenia crassiceps]|uniref:Uncharacterized protein n=1 Tax=Taenia crassiceps TaxID=6207 RepID=A0ABR4Q059_9CEST
MMEISERNQLGMLVHNPRLASTAYQKGKRAEDMQLQASGRFALNDGDGDCGGYHAKKSVVEGRSASRLIYGQVELSTKPKVLPSSKCPRDSVIYFAVEKLPFHWAPDGSAADCVVVTLKEMQSAGTVYDVEKKWGKANALEVNALSFSFNSKDDITLCSVEMRMRYYESSGVAVAPVRADPQRPNEPPVLHISSPHQTPDSTTYSVRTLNTTSRNPVANSTAPPTTIEETARAAESSKLVLSILEATTLINDSLAALVCHLSTLP